MNYDENITKKNIENSLVSGVDRIPKLYKNSTIENFEVINSEMQEKINICREALKTKGLFLSGNTGSGKTHLAIALMKELAPIELDEEELQEHVERIRRDNLISYYEKEERIRITKLIKKRSIICGFKHVKEVIILLNEAAIGKQKKSVSELYSGLLKYDCICLDDLGSEKLTATSMNNINFLIEKMCWNLKKLIVTTNLSIEDINKYDPRMASRIAQMCAIVNFNAPDYRTTKLAY